MNNIRKNIADNGGSMSMKELRQKTGNPYYGIRKAISDGEVVRVKQGVYMLADELADTMVDIERIIPGGVLCLYSAWEHHGLSTQAPTAFYVAVETHRRVVTPAIPAITLCYWGAKYCELGAVTKEIAGHNVRITDLEKSVCDAVKFRGKIGMDVCAEVFQNYLRRKDKSISKLMEYAAAMRISSVMKNYLDMWQ